MEFMIFLKSRGRDLNPRIADLQSKKSLISTLNYHRLTTVLSNLRAKYMYKNSFACYVSKRAPSMSRSL